MGDSIQLVYIILPLALAVVVLALVLVLINQLRKEVRLSKLKTVADRYMVKVDSASKLMESRINQYDNLLEEKLRQGDGLVQKTASQLDALSGYSEDLVRLRAAMETYHASLNELAALTSESKAQIGLLEERSKIVDRVRGALAEFGMRFAEVSQKMESFRAELARTLADFHARNNEELSRLEKTRAEKVAALEGRIGGMVGAFEARVSSDIKQFETRNETLAAGFEARFAEDKKAHDRQLREVRQENIDSFVQEAEGAFSAVAERLNHAFSAVASSFEEMSGGLDERIATLREVAANLDKKAAKEILELGRRCEDLDAEKAALASLEEAKKAALEEVGKLKAAKLVAEDRLVRLGAEIATLEEQKTKLEAEADAGAKAGPGSQTRTATEVGAGTEPAAAPGDGALPGSGAEPVGKTKPGVGTMASNGPAPAENVGAAPQEDIDGLKPSAEGQVAEVGSGGGRDRSGEPPKAPRYEPCGESEEVEF